VTEARKETLVKTKASISHAFRRVREIWAELDYAQRRLFELRTGVDAGRPRTLTIDELEAMYAAEEAALHARLTPHGR
jgi:hypothetical protein